MSNDSARFALDLAAYRALGLVQALVDTGRVPEHAEVMAADIVRAADEARDRINEAKREAA